MRVLNAAVPTVLLPLAVAGMLSGLGRFSDTFDLLNHLTPLYLTASAVLVFCGATLQGRLRLLSLTAGALGLAITAPPVLAELSGALRPLHCRGAPLVILTQNLWHERTEAASGVRMIEGAHADVVALQEVRGAGALAVLRALKARYPYVADCPAWNRWCALAVASDVPIASWSAHVANWQGVPPDQLSWMMVSLEPPGARPITIYDLQLSHPWSDHQQAREIDQLALLLQIRGRTRTMVMGDFNTTPWASRMKRVEDAVGLVRRDHAIASWPAIASALRGSPPWPFPFLPLDHVFASRDLCVANLRRAPRAGSDHFGIIANVLP